MNGVVKLIYTILVVNVLAAISTSGPCLAQDASLKVDASSKQESVNPGINERFLDPALNVKEWLDRFEIESREVYGSRDKVLKACNFKSGQSIADIGAGTGFFCRLFVEAVGKDGWVFAVDISPKFIEHIQTQAKEDKITNLTTVLGTERSTELAKGSVDAAFICDTYHHFEFPQRTLASIHAAIKPGGQLIVIDFERIPGKSREFILGHVRAGKDEFKSEIEQAGFEFVEEVKIDGFKENYFLRFKRTE